MRAGLPMPAAGPDETVVGLDEVMAWVTSGGALARFGRYGQSRIVVHRLESAGRPLPLALALRWMTRGTVRIEDMRGRSRTIGGPTIARWLTQAATEPFKIDALLRRVEHEVRALESPGVRALGRESAAPPLKGRSLDVAKPPLYIRSDLSFGVRAGGSVGHIA